jgi:glutathionylspermidine synthase
MMTKKNEVKPGVYSTHRDLSSCSARFLDFIKDNPESLRRSHYNELVLNKNFLGHLQPWPVFINQETRRKIKDASIKIFDLIISIPRRFFRYDFHKMSQYYEMPQDYIEIYFYGVDDGYLKNLLGRGDFVFSPSGGIKCLEFNIGANLGGWELDLLGPLYENIPVIAKFLKENQVKIQPGQFFYTLLNHLIKGGLKQLSDSAAHQLELNAAIAFPQHTADENSSVQKMLQMLYKDILKQEDSRFKGDLFFCDIDWLKPGKDFLMLEDKKIRLLVEMNAGDIPIRIMNAAENGNLLVYCGPVTPIIGNKLNLALLSKHENSNIFSAEEREAIRKYIPWTRKITPGETTYKDQKVSLKSFIASNKDRLVIKPALGLGGERVYLGPSVQEEKWHVLVEKAFQEKNWVVQEYLEPQSYLFQHGEYGCVEHNVAWGFFVFGSRYAGGWVRILPKTDGSRAINRMQGAEETIVLEVEEPGGMAAAVQQT